MLPAVRILPRSKGFGDPTEGVRETSPVQEKGSDSVVYFKAGGSLMAYQEMQHDF